MKKRHILILAFALALGLFGCGKQEAPEAPELLLVDSKPTQAPTTEPTEAPETRPDFLRESQETTAPSETPLSETKPRPAETAPVSLPVITKEPTGETVTQGEEAWFVARADNAGKIQWFLTPPQGGQLLKVSEAAAQFPELTVQGGEAETLVLGNVPAALDGWAVTAEFTGSGGSVRSQSAVISVEASGLTDDGTYETVLKNCRLVLDFDPSRESPDTLQDLYQLAEGRDILSGGLGYLTVDVNGDGIQELLIGCRDQDLLYALFTMENGRPKKVLQSWARSRYYFCENNLFYYEGSAGAADSTVCLYSLQGTQLQLLQAVWSSSVYAEDTVSYFYSQDGRRHEDSSTQISQQDYESRLADLSSFREPLTLFLTPIP